MLPRRLPRNQTNSQQASKLSQDRAHKTADDDPAPVQSTVGLDILSS
jgi:hypothetical protein